MKLVKVTAQRHWDAVCLVYERLKSLPLYLTHKHGKYNQLVICGYPRSGTSMLFNMVATSLKGYSIIDGEVTALNSIWKQKSFASKCPHDIVKLYNNKIQQKNIHNKNILTIVIIRDIRDVITSKHQWAPEMYMMNYETSVRITGKYPNYKTTVKRPGIKEYFNAIQHFRKLKPDNFVFIKYEDLVADPDSCQNTISRQLSLEFGSPFSEYHKHKSRHKLRYEGDMAPMDGDLLKSSSEVSNKFTKRWQSPEYRERIISEFDSHPELLAILEADGYEQSNEWYAAFLGKV